MLSTVSTDWQWKHPLWGPKTPGPSNFRFTMHRLVFANLIQTDADKENARPALKLFIYFCLNVFFFFFTKYIWRLKQKDCINFYMDFFIFSHKVVKAYWKKYWNPSITYSRIWNHWRLLKTCQIAVKIVLRKRQKWPRQRHRLPVRGAERLKRGSYFEM